MQPILRMQAGVLPILVRRRRHARHSRGCQASALTAGRDMPAGAAQQNAKDGSERKGRIVRSPLQARPGANRRALVCTAVPAPRTCCNTFARSSVLSVGALSEGPRPSALRCARVACPRLASSTAASSSTPARKDSAATDTRRRVRSSRQSTPDLRSRCCVSSSGTCAADDG